MTRITNIALQATVRGVNQATGAASAVVAIPNNSSGQKARLVRVYATQDAYIKQGIAGITAAAGDMIVGAGGAGAVILNCNGASHIACIQVSVAGLINITPLED